MVEVIVQILGNDIFWIGFAIGFVVSMVIGFIIECLCIISGRSDIETWMEEDKDDR